MAVACGSDMSALLLVSGPIKARSVARNRRESGARRRNSDCLLLENRSCAALYLAMQSSYFVLMATILSSRELTETGALARRVGGYDVMIRLERELKKLQDAGKVGKIVRDPETRQLRVVAAA